MKSPALTYYPLFLFWTKMYACVHKFNKLRDLQSSCPQSQLGQSSNKNHINSINTRDYKEQKENEKMLHKLTYRKGGGGDISNDFF